VLIFFLVFSILGVFCLDETTVLKCQLNIDHTAMYNIVLLVVFQWVRNDFANNVFYSTL